MSQPCSRSFMKPQSDRPARAAGDAPLQPTAIRSTVTPARFIPFAVDTPSMAALQMRSPSSLQRASQRCGIVRSHDQVHVGNGRTPHPQGCEAVSSVLGLDGVPCASFLLPSDPARSWLQPEIRDGLAQQEVVSSQAGLPGLCPALPPTPQARIISRCDSTDFLNS